MANKHDENHSAHGGHAHHLIPIGVYVNTLLALLVLTVVTVGVSYVDLGKFNIVANIGIACLKASLVMAFFMGLKYDTNLNRAFILSSFAALILLISLSALDLWIRPKPQPAKVKQMGSSLTAADLPKLIEGSSDLVAKGKGIFETNCAVCHGVGGLGDGAGGAALNPKPRNFKAPAGSWTYGNSPLSIYYTLAFGSPGTGMAAYKSLLPEDRWALVHYLISFAPGEARSGKVDAKGEAVAKEELASAGGPVKPVLPIDFAIQQISK